MKTHYSEEVQEAAEYDQTAAEDCWREHQLSWSDVLGQLALALVLIAMLLIAIEYLQLSTPVPADADNAAARPPAADKRREARELLSPGSYYHARMLQGVGGVRG
jgi:hypothetical protein